MSNNNFSIAGTYDGINYNLSSFTFGPDNKILTPYVNNDVVPPQIKKDNLQEIQQLLTPQPAVSGVVESNSEENPLLQLISASKNTQGDNEVHITKKFKTEIRDNENKIILDNTKATKLGGFKIVDTYGDGNCFFYAFIMALQGSGLKYDGITSKGIRKFLSKLDEDKIKPIFGEDFINRFKDPIYYNTFDQFKGYISENKKDADDNVLSILGHLFGILFVIYRLQVNNGNTEIQKDFLGSIEPQYYVFLLLSNNNHYDLLSYYETEFFKNDNTDVITESLKTQINDYKKNKLDSLSEETKQLTVLGGKKRKTRKNKNKRRKTNKKRN